VAGAKTDPTKSIAQNRRARHEYEIEETFEAGLQLQGTEVKSCRDGRVSLTDAYGAIRGGEAWLLQAHIAPYSHGNRLNHEPLRPRKLLMHSDEIERIERALGQGGRALVPLRMYFKHGLAKVQLGIGRGKSLYDKRQTKARRDAERQMQREVGRRR
jgi:SsrA-binding protein